MRILAVNLLRLGDIVATAPAIRVLRKRFPKAKIDLLVNGGYQSVAKMIGDVDRVRLFDRDLLQAATAEADRPFFAGFDHLQDFVEELSSENYDLVVNFTHNRLSGWLLGLVSAKEKLGLVLDGQGGVSFGSAWFRHLNQQVDFEDNQAFNHTDVFIGAVGGYGIETDGDFFDGLLVETEAGRQEADRILAQAPGGGRRLALQVSTSDAKKEWGDSSYTAMLVELSKRVAGEPLDVFVFGAPTEAARIEALAESVKDVAGLSVVPAIASFAGALSLLEEVDLLVTGDTSIKHIASASSVPVIELILGSADAHRTGSWKNGDWMIRSKESCAPCGHSEKCHRGSHACAEGLRPTVVAKFVSAVLAGKEEELRSISGAGVEVLRVDRTESVSVAMPWRKTGAELGETDLAARVDKTVRRISLEQRDRRFEPMNYGSEIRALRESLDLQYPETPAYDFMYMLSENEKHIRQAEGYVRSLLLQLSRLRQAYEDPRQMREVVTSVIVLRSRLARNSATAFIAEALVPIIEDDRSNPFTRFRRLTDAANDLQLRIEVALKVTRGLESEFENTESVKRPTKEQV